MGYKKVVRTDIASTGLVRVDIAKVDIAGGLSDSVVVEESNVVIPNKFYTSLRTTGDLESDSSVTTANRKYAVPIFIPGTSSYNRIGLYVVATNASSVQLCVHEDNNGVPGDIIDTGGTVSIASAGVQETTIDLVDVQGVLWLSAHFQSSSGTVISIPATGAGIDGLIGADSATDTGVHLSIYQGITYDGTAKAFSSLTFGGAGAQAPVLFLRYVE